jgi:hypothetical protein
VDDRPDEGAQKDNETCDSQACVSERSQQLEFLVNEDPTIEPMIRAVM